MIEIVDILRRENKPLTACQISQRLTARGTPLSERQVREHITVLQEQGHKILGIYGKGYISNPPRSAVRQALRASVLTLKAHKRKIDIYHRLWPEERQGKLW